MTKKKNSNDFYKIDLFISIIKKREQERLGTKIYMSGYGEKKKQGISKASTKN